MLLRDDLALGETEEPSVLLRSAIIGESLENRSIMRLLLGKI